MGFTTAVKELTSSFRKFFLSISKKRNFIQLLCKSIEVRCELTFLLHMMNTGEAGNLRVCTGACGYNSTDSSLKTW